MFCALPDHLKYNIYIGIKYRWYCDGNNKIQEKKVIWFYSIKNAWHAVVVQCILDFSEEVKEKEEKK